MTWLQGLSVWAMILILILIIIPGATFIYLYVYDRRQNQHAIMRNFPVLGRMRYMLEHTGPELRQYLFDGDNENEPFSRQQYLHIVMPAKYLSNVIGFGSKKDFTLPGYYLRNAMFTKNNEEMRVDNSKTVPTMRYVIDEDNLFSRKEHREEVEANQWLLPEEDAVVLGPNCKYPFRVRGFVGQSAMSYGALGENAIRALSKGIGKVKGSWMNTGEGGVSSYHLEGGADLIAQIGSGLYGYRTEDGEFSVEALKEKAAHCQ